MIFFGLLICFALFAATVWFLRAGPFRAMFFLSSAFLMGVGVRYFALQNDDFLGGAYWLRIRYRISVPLETLLFELLVFLIITWVGYSITARSSRRVARAAAWLMPEPQGSAGLSITWVFLGLSWATSIIGLISIFGSMQDAFLLLQKRALIVSSEVVYFRALLFFTMTYTSILIASATRSSGAVKLAVYAAAVFDVAFVFSTGARGHAIMHAFVFLMAAVLPRWESLAQNGRPVRLGVGQLGALVAVLAFAMGIVVVGQAARTAAQDTIPYDVALSETLEEVPTTLSNAIPLLDLYAAARQYTDENGIDGGRQFLGLLTRVIPRSVWEDKPEILGLKLREYFSGTSISGAPPTIMGEFFISFGHVGIVVGGLVFGFILRSVDELKPLCVFKPTVAPLFAFMIANCTVSFVRAGLEIGAVITAYFVVAAILLRIVLAAFERRVGGARVNLGGISS